MTLEAAGFWGVAVVLLASSLAVVLTPNLFHAVLFLAVSLVATGVVFLLLQSPFLFAVQLLLYAGGVVTIVVFAIMLTEQLVGGRIVQTSRYVLNGAVLAAGFFVAVAGFLIRSDAPAPGRAAPGDPTAEIGRALAGPYALPFELLGVLLVSALLGALYFARSDD
ncbi:MAG: NADH-quinone oxidoreductase subunit J [Candidatus Rokubacteria bacterium]|nr:NADH-quinone oxidoreductase subunit J [Candidatus Rokubacteria bacterium]